MKTKLKTFSVWYSTNSIDRIIQINGENILVDSSAIREVKAKNKIDLMKRLPMKVKFNIINIKITRRGVVG